MADATDPDTSHDSSSSSERDPDWYAQQWARLCEEVGTADPTEALARVQALKREANRSAREETDDEGAAGEGLVTVSEVETVFREMNEKIENLRERNAALVERLDAESEEVEGSVRDLHQETTQLLDALDAATADEARERIQKLNQRLESLYEEQETLAQAGLSGAEAALAELDRLRDERDALRKERDRLQADRDRLEQRIDESPAVDADLSPPAQEAAAVLLDRTGVSTPDQADAFLRIVDQLYEQIRKRAVAYGTEVDDAPNDVIERLHSAWGHLEALPAPDDVLPPEVGDVLGIRTVEDARELESLIADLSAQLDRLRQEQAVLDEAGLTADSALAMIESMEAQLADLYHGSGAEAESGAGVNGLAALDDALRQRALAHVDADPDAVDDATEVVRRLLDHLDQLAAEQAALDEAGLDADEAVAMLESMEVQLNDLYQVQDEQAEAAERLSAIEDVLGISTREEAEELAAIARQMEEQLTVVYQEKEKLEELGLSSIDDAVSMIKNMEEQLDELYEDKEALREIRLDDTEEQSTFQQLEALYAEREQLQQALGVSSATDVIELVESLNTQLDDLYTTRDAETDPEERHEARLWEPETDPAPSASSPPSSPDEPAADTSGTDLTLNSMERQLEALYREKETLLHHGLRDAQEAVSQLQTQRKQLDALQRENHTYRKQFDRLQSALGTANVSRVVDLVQSLQSEAGVSLEEVREGSSDPADSPYDLDLEATSPFVDADTLDRLGAMGAEELDALDVGVVCLNDDGTVETLNEAALQLPGLSGVDDRSTVVGKNFFLELAPSTNNNLFYGRFQTGKRRGRLDARFPYTFTGPNEEARSFAVHLYRTPDDEATWLLYRPD
jgi:photoactive yellow protein